MPDYNQNGTMSRYNDTPVTASGTTVAPVQNGPNIQVDKVRYIWTIRGRNQGVAAHDLIIYAGDAGNVANRVIYRITIPALTNVLQPPLNQRADMPLLRVAPIVIGGVTFENQIKIADEAAGGNFQQMSLSEYDLRG